MNERLDPLSPRLRFALRAFAAGAVIGVLGGLIGLGGAEFRLPLLIGLFSFAALHAIILNKAMSLVVVITALPGLRLFVLPSSALGETVSAHLLRHAHRPIVVVPDATDLTKDAQ